MLSNLYIENIAVIEKTNIDFSKGFNVLTGETGAGKSIVIDAISAILGSRTSKQLVRNGKKSSVIIATFNDISILAKKKCEQLGFEIDDDTLIIQREITIDGKSNCRINSRPATLSALKDISAYLICIHGQNDNLDLFSPSIHMHYIDLFSKDLDLLKEYRKTYKELRRVSEELEKYKLDEEERLREIDLLKFQIDEIENAEIVVGEKEKLLEEKNILINSEKIIRSLENTQNIFDGSFENSGVISLLEDAKNEMIKLSKIFEDVNDLSDRVSNAYYEIQDISSEITNRLDEISTDSSRLDDIEERLDLIFKLSKKYGHTEEEILDYLSESKVKLEKLLEYSENIDKLNNRYVSLLTETMKIAKQLSKIRVETSEKFKTLVEEEMAFLEMPNVKVEIRHEITDLSLNGIDEMEFLFSVNPGEPPKPVSKIASGGELSRMMLAIKSVLSENEFIDTLVFDEIDSGISGSAAQKVGLKLKQISNNKQVMCVTHQAQIAALSDNHLLIKKDVVSNKTYTTVEKLDYDGRVKELARIIDGVNITSTALEHAKQLLNE